MTAMNPTQPPLPLSKDINTDAREKKEPDSVIPGLPDDVSQFCLVRIPYPYRATCCRVSTNWNKAMTDPTILHSKQSLSLELPYLFVFAYHESTHRIQWQVLDPRSRQWFLLPPMPCPQLAGSPSGFALASLPRQGKLFVMGGMLSDRVTPINSMLTYSAWTNQWSLLSPMITPRSFFEAGNVKGKIVAVGGRGDKTATLIRSVEIYDPDHNTWKEAAPLTVGIDKYDSAVIGGKVYVTDGGTWGLISSPKAEVYDIDENKWHEMGKGMREGWSSSMSFVLGDRLLVLSDYGECKLKMYIEEYDRWEYVGGDPFPQEMIKKKPFVVNCTEGKIYVVGSGLNTAIGNVAGIGTEMDHISDVKVEWEMLSAPPQAFQYLTPFNSEVLYA